MRPKRFNSLGREALRVLFVDYIHSEIGGGHFVLSRMANYFSCHESSRVKPYVFINNFQEFVSKFIDTFVPWFPFEIPGQLSSVGRNASILKFFGACFFLPFFLATFTVKVIRICKENGIGIIHANGITSLVLFAFPAKILRLKLVFHLHDSLLSSKEGGTIEPPAQRILIFMMRHFADAVVVVSDFVGKTIERKDSRLSAKIYLLHNGLDIQRIRQSRINRYEGGEPLILSYGTLSSRKGFDVGIEAIAFLKHVFGIQARYQIIGDGPHRADLLRLIDKKGLSDQIEVLGFQDKVHKYVAQADIVLIPSVWEDPLPLVVIESMANSKVIVASKSGGITEMISDQKEGFIVPKNNPKKIAERIIYIINHPEEANKVADRAYKRVREDFTIERMALQLVKIYRSALNGGIGDCSK